MISITSAKKELYALLKDQRGIVGTGIKSTGRSEYIVVFVSTLSARLLDKIPATFKGIKVKTERKAMVKTV